MKFVPNNDDLSQQNLRKKWRVNYLHILVIFRLKLKGIISAQVEIFCEFLPQCTSAWDEFARPEDRKGVDRLGLSYHKGEERQIRGWALYVKQLA